MLLQMAKFHSFYGWVVFHSIYTPHFCLPIHPLMDIWISPTPWLLWMMLLWPWVYRYLFGTLLSILSSIEYMPKSGISWFIFTFLRNWHTVFYNRFTILHSHQQCTRIPISSHPDQHSLFSFFSLIVGILMDMRWYLHVVLICISLMISDVEYLLMFFGHLDIIFREMSI